MFNYKIKTEVDDDSGNEVQCVYIGCENCGTLHVLDDNAKKK